MGKKDSTLDDFSTADEYSPPGSYESDTHREVSMVSNRKPTSNLVRKPLVGYVTKAESEILNEIVKLEKQGEPNITGKLLSSNLGLSKGYISKLLTRLRRKGLVESADQRFQKIHRPTMEGVMAVSSLNGGSSDMETSPQKMETSMETSSKDIQIRVHPHDFRFKAEILEGPPFEDMQFKSFRMKGMIGATTYQYDLTCEFLKSEKSDSRWVIVYVPVFFVEDPHQCKITAYKKARETLSYLARDYGLKFSDLTLIYSHIALRNDPFSLHVENGVYAETPDKRIRVDCSDGFPELEATSKYAQEDVERIMKQIFDPVKNGEYNPLAALRHMRIAISQINRNQAFLDNSQTRLFENQQQFSENERQLSDNLMMHLRLVETIIKSTEQFEKAIELLMCNLEQSRKSLLQKLKESGQRFIEDFF